MLRAIGVVAIIAGGWQLSKRPREQEPENGVRVAHTRRSGFRPGIVFPVIAAVAYATSDILVRFTLGEDLAEPGPAAMISTGSGLAAWLLVVVTVPRMRRGVRFGRGTWWLMLSGVLIGFAILAVYHALRRGEVSIVSPINATQPLIVLLLSALFLRDLERIHLVTVIAASAIVVGAILVSL
jgi:uncharacterized membrane protein